jgi:hypothetical protein
MAQQILGTDVQLGSIITVNGVPQVVTKIEGNTITSVPTPGPNPTTAVTATSGNVKAVNGQANVPNVQFADGSILSSATINAASGLTGVTPIANGGTGGATAATNTVFGNNTAGTAAPAFTNAPVVSSVTVAAVAPTAASGQVAFGATHQTTVGAAGGATALPATPTGYLIINVAGTQMVIPYYAQA